VTDTASTPKQSGPPMQLIVGLVIGLIIGAIAGATLPELLGGGPKVVERQAGTASGPRDEGQGMPAGETQDMIEETEDVMDDAQDTAEELADDVVPPGDGG
jgi:hypothetical protein